MTVGMNHATISRTAPRLSLGLTIVFLILLTLLHGLAPEFNSGHLISEYQLSDYGFLMSLAFCLLGANALLLALALTSRVVRGVERIGWWGLLIIGMAFFIAGIFPPVQAPVLIGYLHGISGLVVIFGAPIAFTLISRSFARSNALPLLSRCPQWATFMAWCGLWLFLASLIIASLLGQMDSPLPLYVGLANRLMIVTYCIWFITAAWQLIRSPPTCF